MGIYDNGMITPLSIFPLCPAVDIIINRYFNNSKCDLISPLLPRFIELLIIIISHIDISIYIASTGNILDKSE